jgi:16S rRNA (uracil1498-N3)-methyltransferase
MADSSHRFFVEPAAFAAGEVVLEGAIAHQIARVLRQRVGETIVLLDGAGLERDVELLAVTPHQIRGVVRTARPSQGEPSLGVTLYQALVARERMETVLQKGTEVGVAAFVPVWCERSLVPSGEGVDEQRLERWRRIAREAAEQSRRGRVPDVHPPRRLTQALADAANDGPILVAWEEERERSVASALRALFGPDAASASAAAVSETDSPGPTRATRVSLFIGPVGGFTSTEVAAATALGAWSISLGPRILRTETAGPILAALVLYAAGELEPR